MGSISNLKVRKYTVVLVLVLGVLNCPGVITEITTIFTRQQRFLDAYYGTVTFSVNLLEVLLVLWGIIIYRRTSFSVNLFPILGVVLLKDLILFFMGKMSPFMVKSWEMYMIPVVGLAVCFIVCKYARSEADVYVFLDGLILVNFVTQILLIVSGQRQVNGAEVIGQGHNSVGYLCALHIIYSLLMREKNKRVVGVVGCAFISILFTGSRFSLLIVLLGGCVLIPRMLKNVKRQYKIMVSIVVCVLLISVAYLMANPDICSKYPILSRAGSIFNSGGVVKNILSDQSFKERVESWGAGIRVIKENPLGVSNSYIDIYLKTNEQGFYAFPHSAVLTFYLLWGPVFIICIIWILFRMKRTQEKNMFYFLVCLLCCLCFYGGLETAPKWYAYIFCLLSVIKRREDRLHTDLE